MRKIAIFVVILIICAIGVVGSTIQGTIYDMGLDLVKDTKVEINTAPKQMMIAKTGTYSFNVPTGDYIIKAEYEDQIAEESITVSAEGTFTLDLILLPEFEPMPTEEELGLEEDYDIYFEENGIIDKTILIIMIIICFLAIFGVAIYIKKKKKKEKEKKKLMKADADKVLDFLKKEGGRALQKDIRKHLAISEAKASLLIDELAAKGKVEKIKKGRGNIIILK